ncbi:YidB family protein [Serratia sp. AKBS12]|uniref:YidB family protein n=1 Tax=Serratia sp. AKBS12 TaxID=2974597 RepID=UPI0021663FAD|nr:YidB family protein [Serratia sp. AKBS12]MCS3408075.1 YidB family protein [Serratia sp. AKBS12]
MGLLDGALGGVLGNVLGGALGNGGKGGIDIAAILQWVEQQGGLQAILNKLQQGQLGDIVGSWLGNGDNQSISGDHVQQALGSDAIAQLAEKLGVDQTQASDTLAQLLPALTDKASPNGEVKQDELANYVGKLFS